MLVTLSGGDGPLPPPSGCLATALEDPGYDAAFWRWWHAASGRHAVGPWYQAAYLDLLLVYARTRFLLTDYANARDLAAFCIAALQERHAHLAVTLTSHGKVATAEHRPSEEPAGARQNPWDPHEATPAGLGPPGGSTTTYSEMIPLQAFQEAQQIVVDCLLKEGQQDLEALRVSYGALALAHFMYGEVHASTAACYDVLGHVQRHKRTPQFAHVHFQKAYDIRKAFFAALPAVTRSGDPLDHPDIATSLANLGITYADRERYDDSKAFLKQCLQLQCRLFGADSPQYCAALLQYGLLFVSWKKYDLAESALRMAHKHAKPVLPDTSPLLCSIMSNLAIVLEKQKNPKEGMWLHKEVLRISELTEDISLGPVAAAQQNLALNLFQQQRWVEAHSAFKACYRTRLKQGIPEDSPMMYTVLSWLQHIEENYILEDCTEVQQPAAQVVSQALFQAVGSAKSFWGSTLPNFPNPLARCTDTQSSNSK